EALRHFVLATETHESVTAQDPNPEGWRGRAEALRRLGRPEEALVIIRDLLGQATALQDAFATGTIEHTHGLVLRDLGRLPEARTAWRAALAQLDTSSHKVVAELRELLAAG
ncbi:MAG: hypothetical protein LBV78_18480, partial [Kitasatospora sp.]|nr:hypothetical protein [Kitasatospora sp.]